MELKIYYFFDASGIPFAQKWFEDIKLKHADAGFTNNIYLREAYFLTILGQINPESNWLAASKLKVTPQAQQYFAGNKTIDLIGATGQDLLNLNAAAKNYYEDSENLTPEHAQILQRAEGILLHEIYHCIKPFTASDGFFNKISLPLFIALQIAVYFSTNPLLLSISSLATYGIIFMWIFFFIMNITTMRRNEYLADMHLIKHGNTQSIQGFIDFLQEFDTKLAHKRIFQSFISSMEKRKQNAFILTRYFYTGSIYALTAIQNFYIDASHPAFSTRFNYLSKAL